MWITHPQTGKAMRTDENIKVRCDECLKRDPATKPLTKIKIVTINNRDRLLCLDHVFYHERRKAA